MADAKKAGNPEKAEILKRFFKCGKGEYGEGDLFHGLVVAESRRIAIQYKDLPFHHLEKLLKSKIHEERLIALLILVHNFRKNDPAIRRRIYDFYLAHTRHINNWDLVDCSADKIVGEYLKDRNRAVLLELARSKSVWERRIGIIATFQFIKDLKEHRDTFAVADVLLNDDHDLIHKAVGWMLREVGKRISQPVEEAYLKTRYRKMPRTMLRYAIERFPEPKRKAYLAGRV